MKTRAVLTAFALALAFGACAKKKPAANANSANAGRPAASKTPGPLPDAGFKARITLPDPPAKLRAGEETEVPLLVTAPKEPGDYLLEVDLVQEQVGWFSDKGSPTARAKVTVVR